MVRHWKAQEALDPLREYDAVSVVTTIHCRSVSDIASQGARTASSSVFLPARPGCADQRWVSRHSVSQHLIGPLLRLGSQEAALKLTMLHLWPGPAPQSQHRL